MNKNSTPIPKTAFLVATAIVLCWSRVTPQVSSGQNIFNEQISEIINSKRLDKNELASSLLFETYNNSIEHYTSKTSTNSKKETTYKKTKPAKWKKFSNKQGAFSVNLPGEPSDISRDAPNPIEEDGEPYQLKMFTASDEKKENLYLVRYNDMPNGYYLNDKEAGFSSIQDNLEGKAVLSSDPKEIKLGDIEGREIDMRLQGKYHAIMRIYIRGNRMYVLMAQKLNTTDKISANDEFLKSFKFEDYAYVQPTTYKPSEVDFEISFFGNVKIMTDSIGYESTSLQQTKNYYSINPSSGGLYHLNRGDLQDYVQIKDLKEFYDEHIQLYLEWNDTITAQKDIKIDGHQGVMFTLRNKGSNTVERRQMWLDNSQLFVLTGYLSKEERENPISDLIFNSFKYDTSKDKPFDRLSSKTDKLLKDLHSADTLIVKRAMGAFAYYKFENTDLPKLYQSLEETYSDSLYANAIKDIIISVFPLYHDENTLTNLKTLYTDTFKNDEELKSAIISVIPAIEEENALDVYKELMQLSPPKSSENYSWEILSPFRDSIPFTVENFKLLTSLTEHDVYRYSVLDISTTLVRENPDHKSLVMDEQNSLLKFAKKDLDLYVNSLNDTLVEPYKYSSLMFAYLSFLNQTAINSDLTDAFTSKIISFGDSEWHTNQAITARIRSKQSLDKELVTRLMDSLYYRFEIMKAYHDIAQFQEVPNKYKQTESFAELSLHFNLSEEDYEPESMQIMGEIDKNGLLYYAYKVKYDEGEEALTSYIVSVGPIKDVSTMEELELYEIHTEWEQLDYANWESQAEKLIPNASERED